MILALIRFLSSILGFLPLHLVQLLGYLGGYFASYITQTSLKIAKAQIQFALDYPEKEAEQLARQTFGHVGTSALETLCIADILGTSNPQSLNDFKYVQAGYPGEDPALKLSREGQGFVALSGHLGSFELLAATYMALGLKGAAFGRSPNYSWLEECANAVREDYGLTTLWRQDKRSIPKLLRCIKEGGVVMALIDQDTKLESAFSPFFGQQAACPLGPVTIALRYRLPIFTSFIVRKKSGKHLIYTKEISYQREEGPGPILDVFHQRLEAMIRAFPEQWIWWHRRWRRQPGIDYSSKPEALRSTNLYLQWLQNTRAS